MGFPTQRPRRLRRNEAIRTLEDVGGALDLTLTGFATVGFNY